MKKLLSLSAMSLAVLSTSIAGDETLSDAVVLQVWGISKLEGSFCTKETSPSYRISLALVEKGEVSKHWDLGRHRITGREQPVLVSVYLGKFEGRPSFSLTIGSSGTGLEPLAEAVPCSWHVSGSVPLDDRTVRIQGAEPIAVASWSHAFADAIMTDVKLVVSGDRFIEAARAGGSFLVLLVEAEEGEPGATDNPDSAGFQCEKASSD